MLQITRILKKLIQPEDCLSSVYDISVEYLVKYNVEGIILDMDNTIVPRGEALPSLQLLNWIDNVKENGIKICIASNNSSANRIIEVSDYLDVPAVMRSMKPFPIALNKICRDIFALPEENVLMIGDQYFTDIIGGNLAGIRTVYVEPLGEEISNVRKKFIDFDRQIHEKLCN